MNDEVYQIFLALQKGFLAFLVMGIFLHVFEDSMVNLSVFCAVWNEFRLVELKRGDKR